MTNASETEYAEQTLRYFRFEKDGATPCPVEWCDQAGAHPYDDQLSPNLGTGFSHTRKCRHETGHAVQGLEIGAEVFENEDGQLHAPVVEIGGPGSGSIALASMAEVATFIEAVLAAANIAFPAR